MKIVPSYKERHVRTLIILSTLLFVIPAYGNGELKRKEANAKSWRPIMESGAYYLGALHEIAKFCAIEKPVLDSSARNIEMFIASYMEETTMKRIELEKALAVGKAAGVQIYKLHQGRIKMKMCRDASLTLREGAPAMNFISDYGGPYADSPNHRAYRRSLQKESKDGE